jgi:hypothetical protein
MTLNDKSTSADIAQHTYGMGEAPREADTSWVSHAHHIEAQRFTRLDLDKGTLARVTPADPRWPFVVPLAVMAGLALGVLIERMWL